VIAAGTVLAVFGMAPSAAAKPRGWLAETDQPHPWTLSLLGAYHYPFFLGASVVGGFPLAPRGFSSDLNDGFYMEVDFSAGLSAHPKEGARPMFYALAGARYQVKFFDWLSAYHALRFGLWQYTNSQNHIEIGPNGAAVLGVMFEFVKNAAGHLEIGYPGIRTGITFGF
jgi:hypothetical protein